MQRKAGLDEAPVDGAKVLLRVDFNVPLDDSGGVRDDARIRAALPTIRELVARRAAVVLVTHLGRPKGLVVPSLTTAPLAARLSNLLDRPVAHSPEVTGAATSRLANALGPGQLLLLENVRFRPEEEANDAAFSAELAALAAVWPLVYTGLDFRSGLDRAFRSARTRSAPSRRSGGAAPPRRRGW